MAEGNPEDGDFRLLMDYAHGFMVSQVGAALSPLLGAVLGPPLGAALSLPLMQF